MENTLGDHFDVIILGTGMIESLVSAALARVGKSVLHLDKRDYYGSSHASYNIRDLAAFLKDQSNASGGVEFKEEDGVVKLNCSPPYLSSCSVKNFGDKDEKNEDLPPYTNTEIRKFNMDMHPLLLWSHSAFIDLLIRSGVCRYLEFKAIERVLMMVEKQLVKVPCSKAEVFKNKNISLVEKRQLMKFLSSITAPTQEDEDLLAENLNKPFLQYLEAKKLNPILQAFILYAIAIIDKSQTHDGPEGSLITTAEGLERVKRFMGALGKYGETPFIVPIFGTCEISQAFCRLAAVYGATYCLARSPSGVHVENNKVVSVQDGTHYIRCNFLVGNVEHLPMYSRKTERSISRCICVTTSKIGEDELLFSTIPPGQYGNKSTIYLVQLNYGTMTCPQGKFLVHLSTEGTGNPKEDLGPIVESLFIEKKVTEKKEEPVVEKKEETTEEKKEEPVEEKKEETKKEDETQPGKPTLEWTCYFSHLISEPKPENPNNLFVVEGIDNDIGYETLLQKAEQIFRSICPEEEVFIPLVPHPEDIIYDIEVEEKEAKEETSNQDDQETKEE